MKPILFYSLLIVALALFSCDRQELLLDEATSQSNEVVANLGGQTFHSLVNNSQKSTMVFTDLGGGTLDVSVTLGGAASAGEKQWYFKGDAGMVGSQIVVPSTGGPYWVVSFDPNVAPALIANGSTVDLACECTVGGSTICEVHSDENGACCDGECEFLAATPVICVAALYDSGWTIAEATALVFNGTTYN